MTKKEFERMIEVHLTVHLDLVEQYVARRSLAA
jgi:hypothetical protein